MGKDKKSKISLFFLLSYIVLIPLINGFMKILEKCFNTNLNTIDINFLNLFTVIFRNGTIFIIWVILNLIIILVAKNISTTKHNAKIEVEGVNLKKKDGTFDIERVLIRFDKHKLLQNVESSSIPHKGPVLKMLK